VVDLYEVDNEMREHFLEPPDGDHWLYGWYNTIGLMLACGYSLEHIIKTCDENKKEHPESRAYYETRRKIAEYLNERFVSHAWAEIGNRTK
jgi:hypothetical protein